MIEIWLVYPTGGEAARACGQVRDNLSPWQNYWEAPKRLPDGRWAFPKPPDPYLPKDIGVEEVYDPAWFHVKLRSRDETASI